MSIPAAWYPDPDNSSLLRWWDGSAWTEHRHPLPASEVTGGSINEQKPAPTFTSSSAPSDALSEPRALTFAPAPGAGRTQRRTFRVANMVLSTLSVLCLIATGFMLYIYINHSSLSSHYLSDLERLRETEQEMTEEITDLTDEVQRLEEIMNGMWADGNG